MFNVSMRLLKFTAPVFMFFQFSHALADEKWVLLDQNGNFTFYSSKDINKKGGYVEISVLMNLLEPKMVRGRAAFSMIERREYDCKNETYRTVSLSIYSDHYGKGEKIADDDVPTAFSHSSQGSADEGAYERACED